MVRREGDSLILEGPVTLDTVLLLVPVGEQHFREGAATVDFSRVTEVDSSALALALEWTRQASRVNVAVRFVGLPASMQNLANLYGVSELLRQST